MRITSYNDLVTALRARQDELGLSCAALDELTGLAAGYTAKVLGPARTRIMSGMSIDLYLTALAIDLEVVPSAEKLRRMERRWEKRIGSHVRRNHKISNEQIERVKPHVLKQWSHHANIARMVRTTPEVRRAIASKAGKASGRARRLKARAM
jgi:hypothetical protein